MIARLPGNLDLGHAGEQHLHHFRQFGNRDCESGDGNALTIMPRIQRHSRHAFDGFHVEKSIEEDFWHVQGINRRGHSMSFLLHSARQIAIDILALLAFALLISATGVGIAFSIFVLLFVKL